MAAGPELVANGGLMVGRGEVVKAGGRGGIPAGGTACAFASVVPHVNARRQHGSHVSPCRARAVRDAPWTRVLTPPEAAA